MPRITTYQATGKASALQLPGSAPVEDFSYAYRAGRQIHAAGGDLQEVANRLQAQQDEIDATSMIGEYEGRVRGLQLETDTETTDPRQRIQLFDEKAKKLETEIGSSSKNTRAVRAFQSHVGRNYPVHKYQYGARTLEYQVKQQFAQLGIERDRFSRLAAQTEDPVERDQYIKQYESLVDKLTAGGLADPLMMQKEKEGFREQSQLEYMDILRMRDPDKLFALEEKGAFAAVDPRKREAIMYRAERERAHRAVQGQEELRRAMATWRESIERETTKRVGSRTLTQEWIDEYAYAVSDEKLTAWNKALRDQSLGVGGGDPTVMRDMQRRVFDPRQDPRQVMARLDSAYVAGGVGYTEYGSWAAHLEARIERKRDEGKSDQKEGEVRIRELKGRRADQYLDLAKNTFRVTGGFESIDFAASEARDQFHAEFLRRVDHYGQGDEDGGEVFADAMPRFITQVTDRLDTRLTFLRDQLGKYTTKDSLRADRAQLGEVEYERRARYLQEYRAIQSHVKSLELSRKEAMGGKK